MSRRWLILLTALLPLPALAGDAGRAGDWQIGPIIDGRNYSAGMPLHPADSRGGWFFDFPQPTAGNGHVHYLTVPTGSLRGAQAIRLRYRIDAEPGVRFVPQEFPDRAATLSLYFQRRGDNWRAKGARQFYRWYSPEATIVPLSPGEHTFTVQLSEEWISVYGKTRSQALPAFEGALAQASRVGFVLGSAGGRGHGVFATGPARMTVLDFQIVR